MSATSFPNAKFWSALLQNIDRWTLKMEAPRYVETSTHGLLTCN
jgi:hypothetical protein